MEMSMLSSWIRDLEGPAVESDPAERQTVSSELPSSPSLDHADAVVCLHTTIAERS